jgi:hypothetical protein
VTRRVATAGAIAAVVAVVAVLLFYAVRVERPPAVDGPPTPTSTASPTVAAATPTGTVAASPSATATAAASPAPTTTTDPNDYGYVFTVEERIEVRRERDASLVFELAGVAPAVSVDGKRLAYWRLEQNVGATDLRVLDVANPAGDRSVFTLSGQTLGGSIVWSNDGQGLLVSTYSRERITGGGIESCPIDTELLMVDLSTTPAGTRSAGSGGCALIPVAWDRPGKIAAAVVTGPGGYATEYLTWNGNAAPEFRRAEFPHGLVLASSIQASADAEFVMGLEDSLTALRIWPIDDSAKAERIESPLSIGSPHWRQGPTPPYEVTWRVGNHIDLFRYQSDLSMRLYTSRGSVAVTAVRPDGSAILISEIVGGPPPPPNRLFALEIGTRKVTDMWTKFGGVHSVARGVLFP